MAVKMDPRQMLTLARGARRQPRGPGGLQELGVKVRELEEMRP